MNIFPLLFQKVVEPDIYFILHETTQMLKIYQNQLPKLELSRIPFLKASI